MKIYKKKNYKKIYHPSVKKIFGYTINMPKPQQNEIEQIKKEIDLLQDRLKKNEKSQNQFQNGLMRIKNIRVKKRQRQDFFQTKKNTKYSEEYIAK